MALKMKQNMGEWNKKKFRKKTKGSQTPGKAKRADTCQATVMEKYFARCSRSYKHKDYGIWAEKTRIINHGKR